MTLAKDININDSHNDAKYQTLTIINNDNNNDNTNHTDSDEFLLITLMTIII